MSGRFIVLEGIDGSGKSTQAEILAARLKKQGANAYLTREPSDGVIGKLLRRALRFSAIIFIISILKRDISHFPIYPERSPPGFALH